jgi:hypothetical protein
MKLAVWASVSLAATGNAMVVMHDMPLSPGLLQTSTDGLLAMGGNGACKAKMSKQDCAAAIASQIATNARKCFAENSQSENSYKNCVEGFCGNQCGKGKVSCQELCTSHADPLYARLAKAQPKVEKTEAKDDDTATKAEAKEDDTAHMTKAQLKVHLVEEQNEQADAMKELQEAQQRMSNLNGRIKASAENEIKTGNKAEGEAKMAKVAELDKVEEQINGHLANVQAFSTVASRELHQSGMGLVQKSTKAINFLQVNKAPEDELAKEMTHDLEMNFNKIAPFGKEDTAKELQDHAAKTQDTLVDAVENAEVAEIKRAVFRALTRLRAATIKEFDTIARLETQAIDAYNDAHHYRAENPLAHLHEDEAPVETDKLKSFH